MDAVAPPRDAVFWHGPRNFLAPLRGTVRADVAIVGGGMMGLMCAKALAGRGVDVCLIEADTCGSGASGRSSGFITPDSELELSDLVRRHGREGARELWAFGRAGVAAIRETILGRSLDCDYSVQDSLFVAATDRGAKTTQKEYATQADLGYAARYYQRSEMRAVLGSDRFHGAVRTGETFGIDGWRFCQGLWDRLVAADMRIFEQSRAEEVRTGQVVTRAGSVRARQVVVCVDRLLPQLGIAPREIYHVQTFLAISEPLPSPAVAAIFPGGPCMVWDTNLIYKYFRLAAGQRLLIGGGRLASTYQAHEQHRPAKVGRALQRYLGETFAGVPIRLAMVWPGRIGISKDFAPIAGEAAPQVFFASGAAGLPWAASLGRYLADKITSGRDELDEVLSERRHFPIGRKGQALIGRAPAFALSHGLTKYFQR